MGVPFPNQRANAGLDQNISDFRSSSGRCAHSRRLTEAHPHVLIIALARRRVVEICLVAWRVDTSGALGSIRTRRLVAAQRHQSSLTVTLVLGRWPGRAGDDGVLVAGEQEELALLGEVAGVAGQ
jgi:hypothetical protein